MVSAGLGSHRILNCLGGCVCGYRNRQCVGVRKPASGRILEMGCPGEPGDEGALDGWKMGKSRTKEKYHHDKEIDDEGT